MFSSCAALRRPHSELLVRRAAFALRARNMGSVTSQAAAPNLVAKAAGEQATFGAGCYCMVPVRTLLLARCLCVHY